MDYTIAILPHTASLSAFFLSSPNSLYTCSPPPLPAWCIIRLDFSHTHHPPASAACLCAQCCVPASSAMCCVRLPPLSALGLFPGPCQSLGGRPPLVPPHLFVPDYLPPFVNPCILSSSVVWFHSSRVAFFTCEDIGSGRLHSLAVARPSPHSPPLNGPAGAVQATRILPYIPPPPMSSLSHSRG